MPLEITQRNANGVYILTLRGRLVLGQESRGFRTTVDKLVASGATKIVVDLEHANYIDSAGLGALMEAHRNTKAKGGQLKLSSLGPNFRQALGIARLLPVFETFPTEAAAVQSLGHDVLERWAGKAFVSPKALSFTSVPAKLEHDQPGQSSPLFWVTPGPRQVSKPVTYP